MRMLPTLQIIFWAAPWLVYSIWIFHYYAIAMMIRRRWQEIDRVAKNYVQKICILMPYKVTALFYSVPTGWKKITLVLLKSKYFQGLFDFLQKKFAIKIVKGLQITCIEKKSFQNHTWPHQSPKFWDIKSSSRATCQITNNFEKNNYQMV